MLPIQGRDNFPDAGPGNFHRGLAAGQVAKLRGNEDAGHDRGGGVLTPQAPFSREKAARYKPAPLSPFHTLCGDMGNSVNRLPVAAKIALAIAAGGGTIGVSPT